MSTIRPIATIRIERKLRPPAGTFGSVIGCVGVPLPAGVCVSLVAEVIVEDVSVLPPVIVDDEEEVDSVVATDGGTVSAVPEVAVGSGVPLVPFPVVATLGGGGSRWPFAADEEGIDPPACVVATVEDAFGTEVDRGAGRDV
jgi:hypothetical protein